MARQRWVTIRGLPWTPFLPQVAGDDE
jgi:hypothetical protein